MQVRAFGQPVNEDISLIYTISNSTGMRADITDFGATVVSLIVKDKNGQDRDVVLGYDRLEDYERIAGYFGSIVGRYANRIKGACVTIDGIRYQLDENEPGKTLHSGANGFSCRIWTVKEHREDSITFSIHDPQLQGFPGNATVEVTYTVTEENALDIHYHMICDRKTPVNLTNHCYFNLNGQDFGSVENHRMQIFAQAFTPIDAASVPTGEILPVDGTPFDFRSPKPIGQDINADDEQLRYASGYDHNFVLDHSGEGLRTVAKVCAPESGITLEVLTDLPGVQFYSANFIAGETGKGGITYANRDAFCLETQYFPNAVNEPNFEAPIVEANTPYESKTIYRFSVE